MKSRTPTIPHVFSRWLLLGSLLLASSCTIESNVSRELGAICAANSECDDRCVQGEDYPDGMCSRTCENDGDCPGNSVCADSQGGICLYRCQESDQCEFLGEYWGCDIESHKQDGQEIKVCRGVE